MNADMLLGLLPLAPPLYAGAKVPTWFWSDGKYHDKQEPFLQWMLDIANTTNVPQVFSVSYGDTEDSLSASYMDRGEPPSPFPCRLRLRRR